MKKYLDRFYRKLNKDYKGSLIKVNMVKELEPNAKEYLNKLAKAGYIEHITWGWYWIPDDYQDFFDFLKKDRNLKVLSGQSAASFWNYDFVHREIYSLKVKDRSYKKALEIFTKSKGWEVEVNQVKDISELKYVTRAGIFVETPEETIINCIKRWAFLDAFAVLYTYKHRIVLKELYSRAYWKRIARSDVRVRQALKYATYRFNQSAEEKIFRTKRVTIEDEFIRNSIDEAVEKVIEFA